MRTKDEALHQRRRAEVLTAAAECFARKGVHQTTMQEICEASSISAGALYRYFPSKEDIIVALTEQEREETRALTDFLTGSDDVAAQLSAIAPDLVKALTEPQYGRLVLELGAEASRNPAVGEAFGRNEAELRDALQAAVERAQKAGFVDDRLDVQATVFLLMALWDGMAGRSAFSPDIEPSRLGGSLQRFIAGLLPRPATDSGE